MSKERLSIAQQIGLARKAQKRREQQRKFEPVPVPSRETWDANNKNTRKPTSSVKLKKNISCRLSTDNGYGTAWVEARKNDDGYQIYVHTNADPEMFPKPLLVGTSKKNYSWRNFSRSLLDLSDGFLPEHELKLAEAQGEAGIRADILRIAWSKDEKKTNWLLEQTERDLETLESQLPSLLEDECLEFLDSLITWTELHAVEPQLGRLRAIFTPDLTSRNIEAIYAQMTKDWKEEANKH